MGRFEGYDDEYDPNMANLWEGNLARALGGKRGQAALREFIEALDAMPVHELCEGSFAKTKEVVYPRWEPGQSIDFTSLGGTATPVPPAVCGLGAMAAYRRVKAGAGSWEDVIGMLEKEYGDTSEEAETSIYAGRTELGLTTPVATQIAYVNDVWCEGDVDAVRWWRLRDWAYSKLADKTGVPPMPPRPTGLPAGIHAG